jgi:hypothetical protein
LELIILQSIHPCIDLSQKPKKIDTIGKINIALSIFKTQDLAFVKFLGYYADDVE